MSRERKRMGKVKVACAIYDTHYPFHHKPTWRAIFDYLDSHKPDIFVFGGDQLDLRCISHHTKNQPIYRTRRAYRDDIDGFDRDILTPLEKSLPKHCEKVWIIGNHEDWEQDLINEQPELEDTVGHVKLLRLIERGWHIVPLGHTHKVGKLCFVHGEILTGVGNQAGTYPSKKAVELYAGNVLAGHTHSPQTFTKISPVDIKNKWQGHISPTAGAVNPDYLRNRPTAWLNGFNRVEFMDGGQFNLYQFIVINGRFSFGGEVYGD